MADSWRTEVTSELMHVDDCQLYAAEPYSLVANVRTAFDAVQLLRDVSRSHGYLYFCVLSVPATCIAHDTSISRFSTVSSVPAELMAEIDRLNRAEGSEDTSIFAKLHGRVTPLSYRVGEDADAAGEWDRLYRRFGISGGVYFPVYDNRGNMQAVSYHGDRGSPGIDEIARLSLFSQLIVERLAVVTANVDGAPRVNLTPRETEVLRWTAEGKTSNEIAIITGLSEHTVNHYVTLATQKLGCSNRTQAVVRAIRLGLFA